MGVRVIVLEKNKLTGRKLRISGKGRCNITNIAEMQPFIRQYGPQGKFLHSAFSRFFHREIIMLLEQAGVQTKEERGGRVFPVTDKAGDVADALESLARDAGAEIITNCRVQSLIADMVRDEINCEGSLDSRHIRGVRVYDAWDESVITARAVIVTTGGASYPLTGSTGDGYDWARETGHDIVDIRPGLVPLESHDPWVEGLSGLALRNVSAALWEAGDEQTQDDDKHINAKPRRVAAYQGEMLFAHFGLTGPIILSLSRHFTEDLRKPVYVTIDLKPALSHDVLDKRLQRDFLTHQKKRLSNAMVDLLPKALINPVIDQCDLDPDMLISVLTRTQRHEIGRVLKCLKVNISGTRLLDEAIVTAGGVSLAQVMPKTMGSKLIYGLYFAGELLDIDGCTGGYNLQAAFSTGWAAGEGAASQVIKERMGC
jgi:predicted Rossmann fold flavoprotein